MYFPYVRGRQYELLALRELIANKLLGEYVVPIVEPVKLSPTLVNVMSEYIQAKHPIAIIRNPAVGSFESEFKDVKEQTKEAGYKQQFTELFDNKTIIKSVIMQKNAKELLYDWKKHNVDFTDLLVINNDHDSLDLYEECFEKETPQYVLVPDETSYRRRIRKNKVLFADRFDKREKNADYKDNEDVFFSDDHLYYKEENYIGFSDFSIIGNEYQEAGFAPYAVAIHIVYFDKNEKLRVKHFVSDSNDDINNPALKFYEAVSKLAEWYHSDTKPMLLTHGLNALLTHYDQQSYPGLGTIKKLSLMHHLELIGKYLSGM